jgi:oxygen-dependent protoporphyrinogen oxidase
MALDLGPQRMRLTPGLTEIVEEVGLLSSLLYVKDRKPFAMYWKGSLHPAPTSFKAALTTPLISWPGKLRALGDLLTPPPRPNESVGAALSRKLGPEIYERLAGPILGGLYGSDPEEMEARHTLLPALARTGARRSILAALRKASRWDSLPAVSFRAGMGSLSAELAKLHSEKVELTSPVREIQRRAGGGFYLLTEEARIHVQAVILALPAPEAAKVLTSLAPETAARLVGLRYNPLAVVHLLVPDGEALPDVGSGFKTTLNDPMLTRGVTCHGGLFGAESERTRLFTSFLGGMGREAIIGMSEEEIFATAVSDFRTVTKANSLPIGLHRTWMPAWDRSWGALDGLELPAGIHLCSAFSGRPGIPGRLEQARQVVTGIGSALHS